MSRHAAVGRTDRCFMAIKFRGKKSYDKRIRIARGEGEKGVLTGAGLDVNFGLFEKKKMISSVYLKNGVEVTVNSRPIWVGF